MIDNVTIAGQPVCIDFKREIEDWIERYIESATHDPFFHPELTFNSSLSGWDHSNNFYFESTLPQLPPIRLGCIQWPCVGATRFARGMFLVDLPALRAIAVAAWGVETETTPEEPGDPEAPTPASEPIPPDQWLINLSIPVDVVIVPAATTADQLIAKMHVLPPIQVAEGLWIVRLVDQRFLRLSQLGPIPELSRSIPQNTWTELFAALSSKEWSVNYFPESGGAYGKPDTIFANSNAPLSHMIDAACFSVGCRPVVPVIQPSLPTISVKCQQPGEASSTRMILLGLSKVTGGSCAIKSQPSQIEFSVPEPWSHYSGHEKAHSLIRTTDGAGPQLSTYLRMYRHQQLTAARVHETWTPEGILSDYLDAITTKITQDNGWNQLEHTVCLPGAVKIEPGGHDDFIEWDWSHKGPVTRVHSLPSTFFPKGLLAQHPADPLNLANPCAWFATPQNHTNAMVVYAEETGRYSATTKAWLNRFAEVQIVDEALLVAGTSAEYRSARVKALIATEEPLLENESVEMHFCDIPMETVGAVSTFTGWVIRKAPAGTANLVRFTLVNPLPAFGSTDATISSTGPDDGTEIVVVDWVGNSGSASQLGIAWFDGTNYWVVEILAGSSSSVPALAFVLTSAPAFGGFNAISTASAVILNPNGSTGSAFTVKFVGRTRARVGSRGVAVQVSGEWIVSEIQQPALRIRANLLDTLHPADATAMVTQSVVHTSFPIDIPASTGEPPYSSFSVANPKKLCGFGSAIVDLQYDAATNQYFIDSIERQAFRIRGTVISDFGSTDATVNINAVIGLDGALPTLLATSGAAIVANVHQWSGSADSIARAEYNGTNNQWELYQIDCHEDQGTINPLVEEPI